MSVLSKVLFCKLAEEQRTLYKGYLDSGDIKSIIDGRLQIFVGLTNLRKICNHPDLFQHRVNEVSGLIIHLTIPWLLGSLQDEVDPRNKFGAVERSGKMMVVDSLLRIWKEQKHRALVFSQSKKVGHLDFFPPKYPGLGWQSLFSWNRCWTS